MDYMLDKEYLQIANLPMMWVMVVPCVIMVLVQAWVFMKKSINAGHLVGLTADEVKTAVRVGAICSIGPGLSMFTIMIAMMSLLGGPFAWLRLSIIGTVVTETLGAQAAAQAMGVQFGGANFGIMAFVLAVWVITLNTWGFFIFNLLFAHKFEDVRQAVEKYDIKLFNAVGTCVMVGAIAMFTAGQMVGGHDKIVAVLASCGSMLLLMQISKKMPKLNEYGLGIAMLIGMFAAQFVKGML